MRADTAPDADAGLFQPTAWTSTDLVALEERAAVDGELRTELYTSGTPTTSAATVSTSAPTKEHPGPTMRLQPGDTLRVRLVNDLPPNQDPMPATMNLPHHFNTTNVHTHGLHVSPSGDADNIFRAMEPGQSYDIAITIPDDLQWHLLVPPPPSWGRRRADLQWDGGRADRRG